jgi:phosphatidylglycerol:prolipoprotein diacylglycerol transferase
MLPLTPFVLSLGSVLALIAITPDPIAIHLGPVPVFWYGVCYAIGLAAAYIVITREARRRGLDARLVDNGIIIVGIAALLGGRLYHVIDQWHLYQDDPIKIILPPYTGLGVYGGIVTGTIVAWYLTRRWHQSFGKWADVIAPGLFVMQAIGRWGNFFNQELYGPPTDLPWGITIDCAHRVGDHGIAQWSCDQYPVATTGFHPLFLYESLSGVLGAITLLWIARRWGSRMRPGDLFLIFIIWYAVVRFALETFRTGNWTFFGVPTAMLVSAIAIVATLLVLAYRHRPGAADGDRWGEPPVVGDEADDDEEWVEVDEDDVTDDAVDATATDENDDHHVAGPDDMQQEGSAMADGPGVPGDEGGDRDPA